MKLSNPVRYRLLVAHNRLRVVEIGGRAPSTTRSVPFLLMSLKERENTLVTLRMVELKNNPVEGRFDFDHMKEIHRRLFQDVYEWAGQVRQNFNAAKQDYEGGNAYPGVVFPELAV